MCARVGADCVFEGTDVVYASKAMDGRMPNCALWQSARAFVVRAVLAAALGTLLAALVTRSRARAPLISAGMAAP